MFFFQLTHFLDKKSYQHNDFSMVNNEYFLQFTVLSSCCTCRMDLYYKAVIKAIEYE